MGTYFGLALITSGCAPQVGALFTSNGNSACRFDNVSDPFEGAPATVCRLRGQDEALRVQVLNDGEIEIELAGLQPAGPYETSFIRRGTTTVKPGERVNFFEGTCLRFLGCSDRVSLELASEAHRDPSSADMVWSTPSGEADP